VLRKGRLLIDVIPDPGMVVDRLGDALREVELLRRLLRLADLAEEFRHCDRRRFAKKKKEASCGD
jgi:hypothetical protein